MPNYSNRVSTIAAHIRHAKPADVLGTLFPIALVAMTVFNVAMFPWPLGYNELYDDALITCRYALNLVETGQPVFNPHSGWDRVEGYSNPLYLILSAIGIRILGAGQIHLWLWAVNAIFIAILGIAMFRIVRPRQGNWMSVIIASILVLSPVLGYAMWTGLETPATVLGQFVLFYALWRIDEEGADYRKYSWWATAAAVLLIVNRVDGFITAGLACLWLLAKRKYRAMAMIALATCLIMVPHTIFRLWYYHDYIANTVHAKSGGALADRLASAYGMSWEILISKGLIVPFLIIFLSSAKPLLANMRLLPPPPHANVMHYNKTLGIFLISKLRSLSEAIPPFHLVFAIFLVAFFVNAGGDLFKERFFVGLIPIALFLVSEVSRRKTAILLMVLGSVAAAFAYAPAPFPFESSEYDLFGDTARLIKEEYPAGTVIAAEPVGKIGYLNPDKPIVDMLGLNDRVLAKTPFMKWVYVAHNRRNLKYILEQNPDVIVTTFGTAAVPDDSRPEGYCYKLTPVYGNNLDEYLRNYRFAFYMEISDSGHFEPVCIRDYPFEKIVQVTAFWGGLFAVLERRDRHYEVRMLQKNRPDVTARSY